MTTRDEVARNTLRLIEWATATGYADLPREVASRAGRVIGDNLAAIVAARDEPEVLAFHRTLLARPGPPEATLFHGGRSRTDRMSAAVGNALAADWLELEEGYRKASCHAGLFVLPALLAEAEAGGLRLGEVLRTVAVAYEVVTRIARAWPLPHHAIHGHARYAAVGAAAATALARRMSCDAMRGALTASATFANTGPHEHGIEGALIRNAWPAAGTWTGMMSTVWADCGITGLPGGLHDVYARVLGGDAHPEVLVEGLGTQWAILDGYSKMHACCQFGHSTVEAVLAVRGSAPAVPDIDGIEELTVAAHALALPMLNYAPQTTLAGKFSLPHIAATTWVHGHANVAAFGQGALHDPRIAALRSRVKVVPFLPELPAPNDRPARVSLRLRNGQRIDGECLSAPGGPDRPFPESAILQKIATLTGDVYPHFAPMVGEWMAPTAAGLDESWASIVTRMCDAP